MDGEAIRTHAREIWQTAVAAVQPEPLVRQALTDPHLGIAAALKDAQRILVLGGGKAGTAMSAAVEAVLEPLLDKVEGVVNVPAESVRPLQKIRLHAARPAGVNHPTAEGVAGAREILGLAQSAGPHDVGLCLISGGGSALLPAPVEGITLADKQQVTKLLHACGATINEMNAVRKHLSDLKGGRLAQAFSGRALFSLIISDVIGDPLDVIASGPTAADSSTFAESLGVLEKFRLEEKVPRVVRDHLQRGEKGLIPETLKTLPEYVGNFVIGNNVKALSAAQTKAEMLGYRVLNLGSYLEGETQHIAVGMAGLVRSIREQGIPLGPPLCILSGGETTVTLGPQPGKGGRNQEFVLAALQKLGKEGMDRTVILSGGTDGEDGPTDAAGALADRGTLVKAEKLGFNLLKYLDHHDAYHFFQATGDLLITGLTQTNVMDVRVILMG